MARRKVFEELGLYEQEQLANPLEVLGIEQQFAHDLLREDTSGETLRLVANGVYRALARRYHPDTGESSDPARFTEIEDASSRIKAGSAGTLLRWARQEQANSRDLLPGVRAELAATRSGIADLYAESVETAEHSLHFRNFRNSNGLLVRDNSAIYVLLPEPGDKISFRLGVPETRFSNGMLPESHQKVLQDVGNFMTQHGNFGLNPGQQARLWFDSEGGVTAYDELFRPIADVTDAINAKLDDYNNLSHEEKPNHAAATSWARIQNRKLMTFELAADGLPVQNLVTREFLDALTSNGAGRSGGSITRDVVMEMPLIIGGTVGNAEFMKERVSARPSEEKLALTAGVEGDYSTSFRLNSFVAGDLAQADAQYSPVLRRGAKLLLHDTAQHMPVATNIEVVGLLTKPA